MYALSELAESLDTISDEVLTRKCQIQNKTKITNTLYACICLNGILFTTENSSSLIGISISDFFH